MSRPSPTIADAINFLMEEKGRIHAVAANAREQGKTELAGKLAFGEAVIDLLITVAVKVETIDGPDYKGAYHEGVV